MIDPLPHQMIKTAAPLKTETKRADPSGAVIPGATVVASNVATGEKTVRQTTAAGLYLLSPLVAGEYTVTVSAGGFQTLLQEHVVVDALSVVGL